MTVEIWAETKEGYRKLILRLDEKQVRMHDKALEGGFDGYLLRPEDFPEAERFLITYRPD